MAGQPHRISLDGLAEKRSGRITNHEDVLLTLQHDADRSLGFTMSDLASHMALAVSTLRPYVLDLHEAGYLRTEQHRSQSSGWRTVTRYFALPEEPEA